VSWCVLGGMTTKIWVRNGATAVWVTVAVVLLCLTARPALAQGTRDIAGTWQGTMAMGKDQRIVLKVSKAGAGWSGVAFNLDSDQPSEARATTQMSFAGAELRFAVPSIEASFTGKLSEDGATFVGTWTQRGTDHPLSLTRAVGDAEWEIPKATVAMAKDADPDWEVVTVKPTDPKENNANMGMDGRQFIMTNRSVETLFLMGFSVHKKQIANAPDWVRTERWDIRGVPDVPGQPSLRQMQTLARKVLKERFGLVEHTEKREMEVYALTVTKGGQKMTPSAGDPNGVPNENDRENGGVRTMRVTNMSMQELSLVLKFFLERPVVDQTGLTGRYDFLMQYTFDESRAPMEGNAPPTIFTAIQEQLGLKLEAVKAQADVLVVDKVERPGAN
jgi:uncharacterized protein (TIGR03435 family)